jgi:hypothetical protein
MTPTPKLDERISTLEEKLTELKRRQERIEARKLALQTRRDRKLETRKKILVGGVVLDRLAAGQLTDSELRTWLEPALSAPVDRTLFGLPPTSSPPPGTASRKRSSGS